MNIQQIMKQAQAMQKKMEQAQEKLAAAEFEGKAGGDMVKVIVNGKGDVVKLSLDKNIVDPDDVEVLEDLIVAAFNDAKKKADAEASSAMSGVAGGMGLPPGMKLPF